MSINTTNNDNNTLLYQQLKVPQQIQIDRLKQVSLLFIFMFVIYKGVILNMFK